MWLPWKNCDADCAFLLKESVLVNVAGGEVGMGDLMSRLFVFAKLNKNVTL